MKILLVEDQPAVRRYLGALLLEFGHVVEPVGTLQEAAAAVNTPDLIVADYRLGEASAQDVGALYPQIPLVVVSGSTPPADFVGEWVMKPILQDELRAAINRAVGRPA